MWSPRVVVSAGSSGETSVCVGHGLVDEYLGFLAGRVRPNSLLAAAFDLKVFFAWSGKEPAEVTSKDVVAFVAAQRAPRPGRVVRLSDGGSGLSARTVARRGVGAVTTDAEVQAGFVNIGGEGGLGTPRMATSGRLAIAPAMAAGSTPAATATASVRCA